MPDLQDSARRITSPNELERDGFIRIRGRILGNARIGKKAGIAVIAILVLLLVAILYGVTLNKPHIIALRQQYAKPIPPPQTVPWWQSHSDAAHAVIHNPPTPSTPQPSALSDGIPNLAQAEAPKTAIPAVSGQRPISAVSGSEAVNLNAKFPTIPLLAGQPVPTDAESQTPQHSTTIRQNIKEALLHAAMTSPSLIDGASQATAKSQGNGLSSLFQLKAGTIIPAALITAIDSDLTGLLTAQVRQNVYDSVSGQYLLIPQGSKIVGSHDSHVTYGQERLLVKWTRLIYPDGSSIDLQDMAGADLAGRSGFDAQVNNHTRKLLQGALLLSIIGAGAQLSQPQQSAINGSAPSIGQVVAGSVGSQIASAGEQITQRQLNVAPNLRVPAGYQFNVLVDHDIVFARQY